MNKNAFIQHIVVQTQKSEAEAREIVETFLASATSLFESMALDSKLSLRNFGTFSKIKTNAKRGRNPRTGEPLEIPPKVIVKFKPGQALLESLKK